MKRHTLGISPSPPPQAWRLTARVCVATVLMYFVPKWSANAAFLTTSMNWTSPEMAADLSDTAISMHDTLVMPLTCLLAWKYLVHDGLVGEQNDPRLSRDRVTNDQWRARWTVRVAWVFILSGCFIACIYPKRKLSFLPIDGIWSVCVGSVLLLVSPKTRAGLVATTIRTLPIVPLIIGWKFKAMFRLQTTSVQAVGPREWVHFITTETFVLVAICELSESVTARDLSVMLVSFVLMWAHTMRTAQIGYWAQAPWLTTSLLLAALYFWSHATIQTEGRKAPKLSREHRIEAAELTNWAAAAAVASTKSNVDAGLEGEVEGEDVGLRPQRDVEGGASAFDLTGNLGGLQCDTARSNADDMMPRGGGRWCPLLRCSNSPFCKARVARPVDKHASLINAIKLANDRTGRSGTYASSGGVATNTVLDSLFMFNILRVLMRFIRLPLQHTRYVPLLLTAQCSA